MKIKPIVAVAAACALWCGAADASLVIYQDQFDNGNPDTNAYGGYTRGANAKGVAEADGVLTWTNTGGNWARTEFQTNTTWEFPGGSVLDRHYIWDIGPTTRTTGDGQRIQVGLVSADRSRGAGSEMYVNTHGGIYFDVLFGTNEQQAQLVGWYSLPGKSSSSDGTQLFSQSIPWDWTEGRTIGIDIYEDQFHFVLDGQRIHSADYHANLLPAFDNGMWAHFMGQNRNNGRGTVSMNSFTVTAIPEPATAALLMAGAGLLLMRTRRGA